MLLRRFAAAFRTPAALHPPTDPMRYRCTVHVLQQV